MAYRVNRLLLLCLAGFCLLLGACAQEPYDYRNIRPNWQISNSPIPVPRPKAKPVVRVAKAAPSPQLRWTPKASQTPGAYTVRAGDSVYGLSRKFNVPAVQIISANNLRKPYHLKQGQRLVLKADARHVGPPAKPKSKTYTVRRGDGLYAIARANGVPAANLIRANALKKPYVLQPGQKLTIPSASGAPTARSAVYSPQTGQATFIWPASGKVISGYGVKADGLRNDGINIAAKSGAPVYATAAGEVIYAGDRLRAFGNLILVRHRSGMVSAYAHVAKLMVQTGQQVGQGQQIATIGKSGLVSSPQLHFELRRNSEAIDPMRYLGRTQMAAAGR